jgi:predicted dehydrogenase
MCEKPMAVSAFEAQKMVETAKKTGKLLTIGYQNRQNAAVRFIKAEAEAGSKAITKRQANKNITIRLVIMNSPVNPL